jgi:hypothetical protein
MDGLYQRLLLTTCLQYSTQTEPPFGRLLSQASTARTPTIREERLGHHSRSGPSTPRDNPHNGGMPPRTRQRSIERANSNSKTPLHKVEKGPIPRQRPLSVAGDQSIQAPKPSASTRLRFTTQVARLAGSDFLTAITETRTTRHD